MPGEQAQQEQMKTHDSIIPGMKYQTHQFGSQSIALSSSEAELFQKQNHANKVLIIQFSDILQSDINLKSIQARQPKGVLFVIPKKSDDQNKWDSVANDLISNEVSFPVYFTFESELTAQLITELQSGSDETIVVSAKQGGKSTALEQLQLDVFYAHQQFGIGEKSQNPIIVISAPYDSLGVAPSMSAGVENSISPVVALIQLGKHFGRDSIIRQMGLNYDLVFLLTPSASLGYKTTSDFIGYQKLPWPRVELVICLDSLVDSQLEKTEKQSLYVLKNQRSESSSIAKTFIKNLQLMSDKSDRVNEAEDLGIFEQTYPTTLGNQFVPYEHIVYGERGIPAITLTAKKTNYRSINEKYSLMDQELCVCKLSKVIEVISEGLARTIVNPDFKNTVSGIFEVGKQEKAYLRGIRDFLRNNSRAPQFIERDSPVSLELFRLFALDNSNAQRIGVNIKSVQFTRDDSYQLPKHKGAGSVTFTASVSVSPIYEFAIFIGVLAYLTFMYQVAFFFANFVSLSEIVPETPPSSGSNKKKKN